MFEILEENCAGNTKEQIEQRLDSRITKVLYNNLRKYKLTSDEKKYANRMFEILEENCAGNLKVVKAIARKCSINTIYEILDDLRLIDDFKPNFIVLDYADIIALPYNGSKDKRFEQADIYWDLKNLALELNIPIFTATQAKSEFQDKRAYSNSLAEAYEKARICDGILTLNQTPDQVIDNEMTLIVAKMRDSKSGYEVNLRADLSVMRFKEILPKTESVE
jgi:replicative DNA helicase